MYTCPKCKNVFDDLSFNFCRVCGRNIIDQVNKIIKNKIANLRALEKTGDPDIKKELGDYLMIIKNRKLYLKRTAKLFLAATEATNKVFARTVSKTCVR